MHPRPDQMPFALFAAMAVIYVAERTWKLTARIITFFDKRSANRKVLEEKRAKSVPSKTRDKLPIAAGGPLPKNQNTSRRTAPLASKEKGRGRKASGPEKPAQTPQ